MQSDPVPDPACWASPFAFLAGTRIATPQGWRTVERVQPSDRVLVPSGAMMVHQTCRVLATSLEVIRVPPACLGNREEAILLPDQCLLGEDPGGLPVRLSDLPGYFGIEPLRLPPGAALIHLGFCRPVALCVAHGLWVQGGGTAPGAAAAPDPAGHWLLLDCAERAGRALRRLGVSSPPTQWPGAG